MERADSRTDVTIYPTPNNPQTLQMEKKILDQDIGLLWNGQVVSTISKHEEWSHLRREDLVNVAPGMDILLSLGLCWVHYDKQQTDNETAANAGDAGGAVAAAVS